MKTYKITKKDLNERNEYIGNLELGNLDGNLEAKEDLGTIKVEGKEKSISRKSAIALNLIDDE